MKIYLKKQLEQQKQLLFLDIPSLKSNKNFLSKLKSGTSSATADSSSVYYDNEQNANVAGSYRQQQSHLYMNLNATPGSSSYDDLDDWEDNSSTELFELSAIPTNSPASEQANVAVISICFCYCLLINFCIFCISTSIVSISVFHCYPMLYVPK